MWLPMSDVFNIGVPGPSGNENDMKPIRDKEGDIFIIDAEIAKNQ